VLPRAPPQWGTNHDLSRKNSFERSIMLPSAPIWL
jgi:hypothetical protein